MLRDDRPHLDCCHRAPPGAGGDKVASTTSRPDAKPLADMSLVTDPFTGNRYTFGGGNPVSFIEIDGHWGFSFSDIGHAVLDVAGLVPVVGEVADVANGIWYAAEGNYVDAALFFASAIPLAGYGASAAKRSGTATRPSTPPAPWHAKATTSPTPPGPHQLRRTYPPPSPAGGTPPKVDPAPAPKAAPAKPAGPSCPNSFTPDTPVLMADGTHKPIAAVKVGDQVRATDPATSRTEARPVTALITGDSEKKLVATGTIIATDNHPFWVDDHGGWIDAGNLHRGDKVRTAGGQTLDVVATYAHTERRRVHIVTVDGIHTYYVRAQGEDVLVHNAPLAVARRLAAAESGWHDPGQRHDAVGVVAGATGSALELGRAVGYAHRGEAAGGPPGQRSTG